MREAIRCTQISDAPRAQHTLAAHLCTSRGNQRAVGGRGHQRQSEVIRSNQRPSESGRRQSTGSHSPSKTVRRRSSGFIRGNQGSSVVIRAHRKPFEGDHQGSSVVIRGHRKPFEGHQWAIIIRAIIISVPALGGPQALHEGRHQRSSGAIKVISVPALGGPQALHEGPPPPPMMTPSAAPRRPAATREVISGHQRSSVVISGHQRGAPARESAPTG